MNLLMVAPVFGFHEKTLIPGNEENLTSEIYSNKKDIFLQPPPKNPDQPRGKIRLDQRVVNMNLASDLAKARSLIMAGMVVVDHQRQDKPGLMIKVSADVRLKNHLKYVSRGGEKLESAIEGLNLQKEFQKKLVIDAGASTGGFTDCALQYGASKVIAIDIGSNQLAWSLRNDPRVLSLEKSDLRLFPVNDHPSPDWIVGDLSFIALSQLATALGKIAASGTRLLILVKPQFELPPELVPEGGVVTSEKDQKHAVHLAISSLKAQMFTHLNTIDSGLKGRSGNQEVFVHMVKN